MTQSSRLSIIEAGAQLRANTTSARALTEACLERIAQRDGTIKAWVHLDADGALAAADRCDALGKAGHWLGPLHGIAVGIKDIFNVAGMPTAFGSDAWSPIRPTSDAASVSRLRQAGAIILGKTVTTSFAMGDAGPTRNPWNPAHSPGGSSSGSAAAVADAMCFGALGTQTVGSVIRPCSFNGLAGMKPGHGNIDISGVQALSWRLDHVGALTRDIGDLRLMWRVLRGAHMAPKDKFAGPRRPARLWRCRGLFERLASDEMLAALEHHCQMLAERGVEIVEDELPDDDEQILAMHQTILAAEAAAVHAEPFARNGAAYPPNISSLIQDGQQISAVQYLAARQFRRQAIANISDVLASVDAMIVPAATGTAPVGLAYTGDRQMSAPSSFYGLPVVCYPVGIGQASLPLGLQLMGPAHSEDLLLNFAQYCEDLAAFSYTPDGR